MIINHNNRASLLIKRGQSRKTLSLKFGVFFKRPLSPQQVWQALPQKFPFSPSWIYSVDGKWLKRKGVILIHRNETDKQVLWWSWVKSESYGAVLSDLISLSSLLPNTPTGAVSDWKGAITSGTKGVFGPIPHQRCLAHVVRDVKRYLAKKSPMQATQELRKIGLDIINVKTQTDKERWITWLNVWGMIHGYLLTEKSYQDQELQIQTVKPRKRKWWYTHKDLRAGYRLLSKNQASLFTHLDHKLIPTTNNGLEAINGDIKTKLANHRGMSHIQQFAFVSWYLTFSKVETNSDLKKLWDYWKVGE